MNILLIEDNLTIIKGLKYAFEKKNYTFTYKTSVNETMVYLKDATDIDIIILDITLPDGNGFDLFETTIKKTKIPTIILTAKDDEDDIVKGLDIGAEDYMTKPFSTKELMARVNRILLRNSKRSIITVKDIKFDYDKMTVYKGNQPINLT